MNGSLHFFLSLIASQNFAEKLNTYLFNFGHYSSDAKKPIFNEIFDKISVHHIESNR